MSPRRPSSSGFTLVEVLAAIVLLALIASATLPVLRSVARTAAAATGDPPAHVGGDAVTLAELAAVADVAMARPAMLIAADGMPEPGGTRIEWEKAIALGRLDLPIDRSRPPVIARAMLPTDSSVERAWVVFSCGDLRVFRPRTGRFVASETVAAGDAEVRR